MKRVLLCGDVSGQYGTVARQVNTINDKQGPFDFLLCCGNFSRSKLPPEEKLERYYSELYFNSVDSTHEYDDDRRSKNTSSGEVKNDLGLVGCQSSKVNYHNAESTIASDFLHGGVNFTTPSKCAYDSKLGKSFIMLHQDLKMLLKSSTTSAKAEDVEQEVEELKRTIMGQATFPIPTYFIDGGECAESLCAAMPHGGSVAPNVHFLGAAGVTTIHGLNIAFLSGTFHYRRKCHAADLDVMKHAIETIDSVGELMQSTKSEKLTIDEAEKGYCQSNAEISEVDINKEITNDIDKDNVKSNLQNQMNRLQLILDLCINDHMNIDILLSCEWPSGVYNGFNENQFSKLQNIININYLEQISAPDISILSLILEPRYHFASLAKIFYQRPYYRNSTSNYLSKFIGLGEVGMIEKDKKPLHALVLKPMNLMSKEMLYAGNHIYNGDEVSLNPYCSIYDNLYKNSDLYSIKFYNKCNCFIGDDSICNSKLLSDNNLDSWTNVQINKRRRKIEDKNNLSEKDIMGLENEYNAANDEYIRKPSSCVVHIKNLPYDVDESSLKNVFETFGRLKFIRLPKDDTGKSIGKAWAVYYDLESANKAVNASKEIEAGQRKLTMTHWLGKLPYSNNNEKTGNSDYNNLVVDPQADCWFCLANPNAEKHLAVHVGNEAYLSIAKGGLNDFHVLIISVTHFPNFALLNCSTAREIRNYINCIRQCFYRQGLEVIVYERFITMKHKNAMHMQIQVVPLEKDLAIQAEEKFLTAGSKINLKFSIFPSTEDILFLQKKNDEYNFLNTSYFYFEAPSNSPNGKMKINRYISICDSGIRLPINFGREVLANLMNVPDKAEWKSCIADFKRESATAQKVRRMFIPFAPP